MQIVIMIGQLILSLSILVILHEFGHFITARMFGIKVEKFYLFFDAWNIKLFKIKYKGTEYGIGWLPLGGYVKISGMIDESMDKEQLKQPPQPWEFRSKPNWQKLIVMLGGVIFNLILGVIIFTFVLKGYSKSYLPISEVNKDGIYAHELAQKMGFRTGDKIVSLDGKKIERFKDVISIKTLFGATYEVKRGDDIITISTPDTLYKMYKEDYKLFISSLNFPFSVGGVLEGSIAEKAGMLAGDSIISLNGTVIESFGQMKEITKRHANDSVAIVIHRSGLSDTLFTTIDSTGGLGFYRAPDPYQMKDYTMKTAFRYGWRDAIDLLVANIKGLGKIVSGEEKAKDSVKGPIGLLEFFGRVWDWENFWNITGMLSLILAFMNILPIPALDGGHVMIIIIETVIGRKLPDKVLEIIQIVGLIIILALMIFVFGIDISNLIKK